MRRFTNGLLLVALVACVHAGAAPAEHAGVIELTAVVEVEMTVLNEKGEYEIVRTRAAKVVPGEEVIYTIFCDNVGDEPAENVSITNPVPEHMLYTDDSAHGAGTTIAFSIDGGRTYDAPERLTVIDSEGRKTEATASDYTHIRWTIENPVTPDERTFVSFRAQLE
jgi:uncharacterized repeat protein (TIGR01451 family)